MTDFVKRFMMLLVAAGLWGCGKSDWSQLQLHDLKHQPVQLSKFAQQQCVFIFLSPECPLCQNYSVKINELVREYASDSLQFVGVFSGTYYPDEQIRRYLIKYEMKLPVLLDPEFKLARTLDAEITPEAFYAANGEILYRGAIDDWAIDLGRKRINVQNDYLREAILAQQQRKKINPNRTKAVGCFIE